MVIITIITGDIRECLYIRKKRQTKDSATRQTPDVIRYVFLFDCVTVCVQCGWSSFELNHFVFVERERKMKNKSEKIEGNGIKKKKKKELQQQLKRKSPRAIPKTPRERKKREIARFVRLLYCCWSLPPSATPNDALLVIAYLFLSFFPFSFLSFSCLRQKSLLSALHTQRLLDLLFLLLLLLSIIR